MLISFVFLKDQFVKNKPAPEPTGIPSNIQIINNTIQIIENTIKREKMFLYEALHFQLFQMKIYFAEIERL
jgi:hypothetical protein